MPGFVQSAGHAAASHLAQGLQTGGTQTAKATERVTEDQFQGTSKRAQKLGFFAKIADVFHQMWKLLKNLFSRKAVATPEELAAAAEKKYIEDLRKNIKTCVSGKEEFIPELKKTNPGILNGLYRDAKKNDNFKGSLDDYIQAHYKTIYSKAANTTFAQHLISEDRRKIFLDELLYNQHQLKTPADKQAFWKNVEFMGSFLDASKVSADIDAASAAAIQKQVPLFKTDLRQLCEMGRTTHSLHDEFTGWMKKYAALPQKTEAQSNLAQELEKAVKLSDSEIKDLKASCAGKSELEAKTALLNLMDSKIDELDKAKPKQAYKDLINDLKRLYKDRDAKIDALVLKDESLKNLKPLLTDNKKREQIIKWFEQLSEDEETKAENKKAFHAFLKQFKTDATRSTDPTLHLNGDHEEEPFKKIYQHFDQSDAWGTGFLAPYAAKWFGISREYVNLGLGKAPSPLAGLVMPTLLSPVLGNRGAGFITDITRQGLKGERRVGEAGRYLVTQGAVMGATKAIVPERYREGFLKSTAFGFASTILGDMVHGQLSRSKSVQKIDDSISGKLSRAWHKMIDTK